MSQSRKLKRALRAVNKSGDTADVYVEGVIGARSGTTAASFREQLAAVGDAKTLRVHFNSEGGVVTQGTAIYNALRAFKGEKIGIVEGLAASIASVILMACDEIRVAKGGFIMIHNPSAETGGQASDLRATADELDKMRGEILDIYETRTGIERSKLEKLVDAETYFTAEEAVAAGIADAIEGYDAKIELAAVARLNPAKVPASLQAAAKGKSNMKSKKMKALEAEAEALQAKIAALKNEEGDGDEEETDEEEESEEEPRDTEEDPHNEDDDEEEAKACVALVRSFTGEKNLALATGKLAALLSSVSSGGAAARAELVSAAIKAGKMPPALKAWALKASETAFGRYLKSMGGASALKLGRAHKPPRTEGAPSGDTLTKAERIVAAQMGVAPEDMIKNRGKTPTISTLGAEGEEE